MKLRSFPNSPKGGKTDLLEKASCPVREISLLIMPTLFNDQASAP
jgi:hypothetical protein